jgi:YD repeat-containing protein
MTHDYELYLQTVNKQTGVEVILPDGGRFHYARLTPWPPPTDQEQLFVHTATPTRFYGSRLTVNATGTGWDLALRDGTVYTFAGEGSPSILGGAVLRSIRDRHGNTLTIHRTYTAPGYGDITRITSSTGRWVAFSYDAGHHITQATDNLGRT